MYSVIILAAGSGERVGLGFNKVLFQVNDQEILKYSIDFFNKDIDCSQVVLVVSKEDLSHMEKEYKDITSNIVLGGSTRQESVSNALNIVEKEYVFIHDGARPYIPMATIVQLKENIGKHISLTPGISAKDTIKEVIDGYVTKTLDRTLLFRIQTPQAFHTKCILKAHQLAKEDSFIATDDTMLIEKYLNERTFIVQGDYRNIKITTKDDLLFLEVILWLELATVMICIV